MCQGGKVIRHYDAKICQEFLSQISKMNPCSWCVLKPDYIYPELRVEDTEENNIQYIYILFIA